MKHIVTVVAVALSLLIGSTSMARDGDGRRSSDRGHSSRGHDRSHDRGHSYRGDSHRGQRDFQQRGFDSRRHFDGGRGYNGDRRFGHDRKFYGDRKFFDGRSYDNRRFHGGRQFHDDRRNYGGRFYNRSWRRGDRLPAVFLSTRFVVNDFYSSNLYRPPRGYRWVRVERDAFLAGVTTGVVLAVVANHF